MKLLSFRGGIHPPHRKKATEKLAVIKANEPKVVYIPLQQHIGAPCEALVKVGDEVKVGQKIGAANAFVYGMAMLLLLVAPLCGKAYPIRGHPLRGRVK